MNRRWSPRPVCARSTRARGPKFIRKNDKMVKEIKNVGFQEIREGEFAICSLCFEVLSGGEHIALDFTDPLKNKGYSEGWVCRSCAEKISLVFNGRRES